MARSLETAPFSLQLTITTFLSGFCLNPVILRPVSDVIGRRNVLISAMAAMMASIKVFFYKTSAK